MKTAHNMRPFRPREPEKSKNTGSRCVLQNCKFFCAATILALHTDMQNQDAGEDYSNITEMTQSKYS